MEKAFLLAFPQIKARDFTTFFGGKWGRYDDAPQYPAGVFLKALDPYWRLALPFSSQSASREIN